MPRTLRTPLTVAATGLVALPLVWLLAFHAAPVQSADGWLFEQAQQVVYRAGLYEAGYPFVVPMVLPLYALLSGWALVTAWRRHGIATALTAAVVLAGANGVAQVLKVATATDRPWSVTSWGSDVAGASWPSGHATASAALAVAFVLAAAPAARRRRAVLLGAWAAGVGLAVVWMGWHMPSDTVGGWALVAGVGGLSVAGLRVWERAEQRAPLRAAAQSSA